MFIPIYLFAVMYMFINVYTDVRYGITKNILHLFAFLYLLSLAALGKVYVVFIGVVFAFIFGLFLRRIFKSYGAGDIKMLIVLSAAFTLIHQDVAQLFMTAIMYLLISFMHVLLVNAVRVFVNTDFKLGTYRVKDKITTVPEAVPLAITTIFWFL